MTETRQHAVAHDYDGRRKRTAADRAKANYLRLRLQYAKLKVDHGWQKQTLSEVENLYFRHSHTHQSSTPDAAFGGQMNGVRSPIHTSQLTESGIGGSSGSQNYSQEPVTPTTPYTQQYASQASRNNARDASTPSPAKRKTPSAKGKERDYSYSTSTHSLKGTQSTPSRSGSPRKLARPVVHTFPPATLSDGLHSSAKYLATTYISSSPFPINGPPTGSGDSSGKQDQALTYDSFWSSHSTWSSGLALTASPTRAGSLFPAAASASRS
ncbi:hypothetical protein BDW22DRAFT_1485310 [Trametopsis cervina]|nr:hypothetical protein BDW22DRAFT_1485310 [Trametopsis cervina]